MITATVSRAHTTPNVKNFRHPILTHEEYVSGCRLGFDTWADTSCSGRHAYVEAFVEGRMVTATGFSSSLGQLENLHIAHVIYAYDMPNGQVILLENNNTIFMGDNMNDSLIIPVQCKDNNVHVDVRPAKYYPELHNQTQCITFSDGLKIPIEYDGVLPFLSIRRPTPEELDTCERRSLTSTDEWDPGNFDGSLVTRVSNKLYFPTIDPINNELECTHLHLGIDSMPVMCEYDNGYSSIYAASFQQKSSISPEHLSKIWHIGLRTAERTLKATTYKSIRTTVGLFLILRMITN